MHFCSSTSFTMMSFPSIVIHGSASSEAISQYWALLFFLGKIRLGFLDDSLFCDRFVLYLVLLRPDEVSARDVAGGRAFFVEDKEEGGVLQDHDVQCFVS